MAIGFGLLRLSPDVFWTMTPREFERAASAMKKRGDEPMRRGEMEMLMKAFPD